MEYKEIPTFAEMVIGQIYVRKDEEGCWEAKGKMKDGSVVAKRTDKDYFISQCVLAVHNSLSTGIVEK